MVHYQDIESYSPAYYTLDTPLLHHGLCMAVQTTLMHVTSSFSAAYHALLLCTSLMHHIEQECELHTAGLNSKSRYSLNFSIRKACCYRQNIKMQSARAYINAHSAAGSTPLLQGSRLHSALSIYKVLSIYTESIHLRICLYIEPLNDLEN